MKLTHRIKLAFLILRDGLAIYGSCGQVLFPVYESTGECRTSRVYLKAANSKKWVYGIDAGVQ